MIKAILKFCGICRWYMVDAYHDEYRLHVSLVMGVNFLSLWERGCFYWTGSLPIVIYQQLDALGGKHGECKVLGWSEISEEAHDFIKRRMLRSNGKTTGDEIEITN